MNSSNVNLAATTEMPVSKDTLERCGQYLFVTKDPGHFEELESIISKWSIEDP
jgi:hypothetical protein